MAVLKLQEAVDARVALDVEPCEARINEHLTTQRVVDYVTNPEIVNPNLQVNLDGFELTKAAQEALKASVEAAEWKSVEVKQNAKGVIVTFSKNEKVAPADVYVLTIGATTVSVAEGATSQITYSVTKNGAPFPGAAPTFVSSVPAKATVSATGLITGVEAGSTVITVAEGELYTGTVTVTVTE